WLLEIENDRRKVLGLSTFESYEKLEENNKNENKDNDEKIDLNKDFLLIESTNIVNDYINMNKKILLSERD
ncbi:MAG: carboxy terminal-processing peptidase, partial [Proteobacteria bacterium]|nr:carboxy terminal-processing peptidase [Pseudomonadota bacterium]